MESRWQVTRDRGPLGLAFPPESHGTLKSEAYSQAVRHSGTQSSHTELKSPWTFPLWLNKRDPSKREMVFISSARWRMAHVAKLTYTDSTVACWRWPSIRLDIKAIQRIDMTHVAWERHTATLDNSHLQITSKSNRYRIISKDLAYYASPLIHDSTPPPCLMIWACSDAGANKS